MDATTATPAYDRDAEHLKLLQVFHYVLAAIIGIFSCIPLIHFSLGLMMISGVIPTGPEADPMPAMVGGIFAGVGAALVLGGWTLAVLILLAGRRLGRRAGRTFCLVVAGLECLLVPMGTVLGVFTIMVLSRPSVVPRFSS